MKYRPNVRNFDCLFLRFREIEKRKPRRELSPLSLYSFLSRCLSNIMHPCLFEAVLLHTFLRRAAAWDDGEGVQFFRELQNVAHGVHPLGQRCDAEPYSTKFQAVGFKQKIFNGCAHIDLCVFRQTELPWLRAAVSRFSHPQLVSSHIFGYWFCEKFLSCSVFSLLFRRRFSLVSS